MVDRNGVERFLKNPAEFPEDSAGFGVQYFEPMVTALLTFPKEYLGPLLTLCEVGGVGAFEPLGESAAAAADEGWAGVRAGRCGDAAVPGPARRPAGDVVPDR